MISRQKEFSKEEYLNWLKTRNENPAFWSHSDCYAADLHIRNMTLKNFEEKIRNLEINESLKNWIIEYSKLGYGSVETDELLQEMGCYPDYMERRNENV